ncbi:unnamed protein product, partial [Mesorhabditis belari]|uniref:Uncharacterized protein n=1 Tax=Mesorhabditis belari TaxID=2138241 RepID=A0AAF3EWI2_9BILA
MYLFGRLSRLPVLLLITLFSFTSIVRSLEFEDPPYGQSVYDIEMPKRNYYQHVWRQIHMNMPREQQGKRAEKLSKVRANAYYRLG